MKDPDGKTGRAGRRADEFAAEVQRRRARKEENDHDKSFWNNVGAMGTVGWTVAIPTAGGVLFGRWLDGRLESNHVFMVFFMLVGLAVGCVVAWRMIAEKI